MSLFNLRGVSPASFKVGIGGVTKDTLVMMDVLADDQVVASGATTDNHMGVALTTQVVGEYVAVQQRGRARILAGGTITRGDLLMWATGGKVVTRTSTNVVCGIALKSAVSGDVCEVELCCPGFVA